MQSTTTLRPTIEDARLPVPGWWLEAFEMQATSLPTTAEHLQIGGMLPSFDVGELGFLALILRDIQRQLLASESTHWSLDWTSFQKSCPGIDQATKSRMKMVFQSMAEIRFPNISSSATSTRLFENEKWSQEQCLELTPSEGCVELISGYVDGHLDFLRQISKKSTLESILCDRAPVVLWTPVWLELNPSEQLVYMRMEAHMQQGAQWLRLDGLLGSSLDELTAGVKFGRKSPDAQTLLMDRLRMIGKLGKKLVGHGVIHREPGVGYMALGPQNKVDLAPKLLWQASGERLKSRSDLDYFGTISAVQFSQAVKPQAVKLQSMLAVLAGDHDRNLPLVRQLWRTIENIPGSGMIIRPTVMVQSHLLFLEWICRLSTASFSTNSVQSTVPFAQTLQNHGLLQLCASVTPQNVVSKFKEFLGLLDKYEDLIETFHGEPSFTVSARTIPLATISYCETLFDRTINYASHVKIHTSTNDVVLDRKTVVHQGNELIKSDAVKQDSIFDSKIAINDQKMRRIAQDELDKMMRQAPQDYRSLRSKYIDSLDEETKTLVLDVQRRLDSKAFDRHLRVRLIRYMTEHPSSWNSKFSGLPI